MVVIGLDVFLDVFPNGSFRLWMVVLVVCK